MLVLPGLERKPLAGPAERHERRDGRVCSTSARCAGASPAARALLGWSQDDLARHSAVSKLMIARLEIARLETADDPLGGYADTREKILAALKVAGVEFIAENGGGPGVRLRKGQIGR